MRLQKKVYTQSMKICCKENIFHGKIVRSSTRDNIPHDASHTVTHTSENEMHTYRRGNSMIEMEESNACNHGMRSWRGNL